MLRTPQRIRRFACLQDCLLTLTCHLAGRHQLFSLRSKVLVMVEHTRTCRSFSVLSPIHSSYTPPLTPTKRTTTVSPTTTGSAPGTTGTTSTTTLELFDLRRARSDCSVHLYLNIIDVKRNPRKGLKSNTDRSDPIVFLPVVVITSGRVYNDFTRLFFLTHVS